MARQFVRCRRLASYSPELGCGGLGLLLGQVKNYASNVSLGRAVYWALKQALYAMERVSTTQCVVSMVLMVGEGRINVPDMQRAQDDVFFVVLDAHPNVLLCFVNGFPGMKETENELLRSLSTEFLQSSLVHSQSCKLREAHTHQ